MFAWARDFGMTLLPRLTRAQKTILTIIGVPLLLILYSSWQLYRLPSATEKVAGVQPVISQPQKIQREQGPNATPRTPDSTQYDVRPMRDEGLEKKKRLNTNPPWDITARRALAAGGVLTGVLSLLIGGLFLLRIHRMGRLALKSRADLLKIFHAGHVSLSPFLVVFSSLLFFAVFSALIYELIWIVMSKGVSIGSIDTILTGVTSGLAILFMGGKLVWNLAKTSNAAFTPAPLAILGRNISPQQAPQLWGFVKQVANRVQAEMPTNIVVGLNECFFVTEGPVQLSSGKDVPPGRTLYLPLPYMAYMSKAETAAVIGHELAHFTGDDTEYSLHFAPIYSHAVSNLQAVHRVRGQEFWGWLTKPVLLLGEFFLNSFHEAVQHWSRKRELAADQMGARAASREAAAAALLRVSVLAPCVNQALATCWSDGKQAGAGVLAMTKQLVAEHGLGDPRDHLEECQAHPTDSHPTTKQRLEALGVPVSMELLAYAQDVRGSRLLVDLGLEGDAADDVLDVNEALEADFSAAAEVNREENIAGLEILAAEGTERVSLYEGAFITIGALLALSLFGVLGPFFISDMPVEAKWGGWIAGPLVAVAGVYFLLRRRKPFVTMTRDGMIFANLKEPFPWVSIDEIDLIDTRNSTVKLTLDLKDDCGVPVFSGDRRVKYKQNTHQIIISVIDVQDMSTEEFGELLSIYWNGGLARAALRTLKGRRQNRRRRRGR